MGLSSKLDRIHLDIRQNKWLWLFSIFCRIVLAIGFIPAGITKVVGERFASGLSVYHPMGQYLEALHHTGYYYTFIGVLQILAGLLLLIPRTVTLGAVLYFPIILNICILSFAVRFDGSFVTAPLMVLANGYVLFWNYDRLKFILPFKRNSLHLVEKPQKYSSKFPFRFAAGVIATIGVLILFFIYGHQVMPKNSLSECKKQFIGSENEIEGIQFCECIHQQGKSLEECLDIYKKAKK